MNYFELKTLNTPVILIFIFIFVFKHYFIAYKYSVPRGLIAGLCVMVFIFATFLILMVLKLRSNAKILARAYAQVGIQLDAIKRDKIEGDRAVEEASRGIYCVHL